VGFCIIFVPLSYWCIIHYGFNGARIGWAVGAVLFMSVFGKYLSRFSSVAPAVNNRYFKEIVKSIARSLGAFLILILLASLIMNMIFGRELRQTFARLKAEGRALTVAEIRPAPVPDDQNAAPLLQKAAELMGYGIPNKPNPKSAPAIREIYGLINSNSNSRMDIATWPAEHREALPRLIQTPEVQQIFTILSEASQKPGYNNNLKYEEGPGMLMPRSINSIRQAVRLLSIKAELAAQNGNTEKAWSTVLEGLNLTDLLRQEPLLITQLVRIACDLVMIDCMERLADKTDVPADKARALIAELVKHTDSKPWIRCMDGERVWSGLWCFHTLQHGSFRDFSSLLSPGSYAPRWMAWVLKYPYMPILKKDLTVYLNLISQVQDYYKVPYWEAAETIRNHPTNKQIPRYCLTTLLFLPSFDAVATRKAEHDAAVAVARMGLALKLFKQKNGAYPDTLDNLAPEFIENIPVDPCTGKALIYRKSDAGFILYSLGKDQHDDNGTPRPTGKNVTGDEPYDIAWKCAR
jgi:hypothetical protein